MDLATLGLEVRSEKVARARDELGKFVGASKRAEAAAKGFGTGATGAAARVAAANDNMARSAGLVTKAYGAMKVAAVAAIVALTAGLVGLTSLMGRFVSSSVEAQQRQAQLASALRSTGGAAGQTLASLNAHAAALQKVTNFGDEATNQAQALLLTFTRIRGDVFPRATEAVQNVATAMGTDLKGAAIQVGKALNDPVLGMTALSRSGITFTEAQKEMVKSMVASGNMLGAQNLILKELETQFGGSAKAARETLGGALTALGNAWGDLFEMSSSATQGLRGTIERLVTAISDPAFTAFVQAIGTVLFGALQAATFAATALVNGIIVLVDNIDTIGVAAGTAGALMAAAFGPAIMSAMVSGFVALGVAGVTAIRAITAAMAANPLGALAIGITIVVTAIYHFRDEIQKAIGVDVVGIVKDGANFIINSFAAAYEDIKFVWNNFPTIMDAAVTGAGNILIAGVESAINIAIKAIKEFYKTLNPVARLADLSGNSTISNILGTGLLGDGVSLDRMPNPAAADLAAMMPGHNANIAGIMSRDTIGEIGKAFSGATPEAVKFAGALAAVGDAGTGASDKAKAAKKSYADLIASGVEFIANQNLERQALGMTTEAANALRYEQDMLNRAANDNIALTPKQAAELKALAQSMAGAEAETSRLKSAMDFARDLTGGFFSDLRQGLANGEGFWKSFGNAALNVLNKITDKLMNDVLDAIFQVNAAGKSGGGGGGIFGWIGKLFGGALGGGQLGIAKAGGIGLYANGTSFAPGGMALVGEEGPELVNLPRGAKVNTANETRRMMAPANSNTANITYAPVYNVAQGADPRAIAELREAQERDRAEFSGKVLSTFQNAQKRRVL